MLQNFNEMELTTSKNALSSTSREACREARLIRSFIVTEPNISINAMCNIVGRQWRHLRVGFGK